MIDDEPVSASSDHALTWHDPLGAPVVVQLFGPQYQGHGDAVAAGIDIRSEGNAHDDLVDDGAACPLRAEGHVCGEALALAIVARGPDQADRVLEIRPLDVLAGALRDDDLDLQGDVDIAALRVEGALD